MRADVRRLRERDRFSVALLTDGKVPLDELYLSMVRMRRFEEALRELWERGLASGEMHLGIGEETVAAGVVAHLVDGDALAVDHRSTPPLVGRGIDLSSMALEMLGSEAGLCGGQGGHMHLFCCGLSGEVAATIAERGVTARFARVATETVIPYARDGEVAAPPDTSRIIDAALSLMGSAVAPATSMAGDGRATKAPPVTKPERPSTPTAPANRTS